MQLRAPTRCFRVQRGVRVADDRKLPVDSRAHVRYTKQIERRTVDTRQVHVFCHLQRIVDLFGQLGDLSSELTRTGKADLLSQGIAHDRIIAEEQSRNTIENAVYSRLVAQPKPGERWVLVTSAFHMPRSIAAFRAAGFAVEAYPVDWRTRGSLDAARFFGSLSEGLARTDTALHEWAGLLIYRLTGKTKQLFPAP